MDRHALSILLLLSPAVSGLVTGCHSPRTAHEASDRVALEIIAEKQAEALGTEQPFHIETPEMTLRRRLLEAQGLPVSEPASLGRRALVPVEHWPGIAEPADTNRTAELPWDVSDQPLTLALSDALVVSARGSRAYQRQKEALFTSALSLDLARDEFRSTFAGMMDALGSTDGSGDETVSGVEGSTALGVSRRFLTGAELTGRIAVDLVKLLTLDKASSFGILGDASITIPLLRGAGRHIAGEPLTQAERNVIYSIYEFERFKRSFAVQVATSYLGVLQGQDRIRNEEQNYKNLVAGARRSRRLADAGDLDPYQVDQAYQNVLRARSSWIQSRQDYARQLDDFKVLLGLPADARIELDEEAIQRLQGITDILIGEASGDAEPEPEIFDATAPIVLEEPGRDGAGPLEIEEDLALALALDNRLDLRAEAGRVEDAQRAVVVAADALRAELTLGGSARAGQSRTLGSAGEPDARLDLEEGSYRGSLNLDLPLERTAERTAYRRSLIELEQGVREFQETEDRVKTDIRNNLRNLLEFRENVKIQAQAVDLAERRVRSTDLLLQAGRAEVRDVLDAQSSLLSAQNGLTAAIVNYRIGELSLQRDMGLLRVNELGLWEEFDPEEYANEDD